MSGIAHFASPAAWCTDILDEKAILTAPLTAEATLELLRRKVGTPGLIADFTGAKPVVGLFGRYRVLIRRTTLWAPTIWLVLEVQEVGQQTRMRTHAVLNGSTRLNIYLPGIFLAAVSLILLSVAVRPSTWQGLGQLDVTIMVLQEVVAILVVYGAYRLLRSRMRKERAYLTDFVRNAIQDCRGSPSQRA